MERGAVMYKLVSVRKSTRYIFCSLLFLFLAAGCVSTSTYKTLESEYSTLQKENQQLKAKANDQKRFHKKAIKRTETQKEALEEMIAEFEKEIDAQAVRIQMLEKGLKVELVERLLFESGSAKVTREGRKILARIAPILKNSGDQEICIIGHADELPPGAKTRAKYRSNWELSTARATNVIRILQWGHGIDPHRLVAEGVAHYRPLKIENDQEIPTTNRAVEILLTPATQ